MEDKTLDKVCEILHIMCLRLGIPFFRERIAEAEEKHAKSVEKQKLLARNVNASKWYNRWWHYLLLKIEVIKDIHRCGKIYRLSELVAENEKEVEEYDKKEESMKELQAN